MLYEKSLKVKKEPTTEEILQELLPKLRGIGPVSETQDKLFKSYIDRIIKD